MSLSTGAGVLPGEGMVRLFTPSEIQNTPETLFSRSIHWTLSHLPNVEYKANLGNRAGEGVYDNAQAWSHIPLPSNLLMNAQSLWNKTTELQVHVNYQHDFRDECFLKMWSEKAWLTLQGRDTDEPTDLVSSWMV